MPKTGKEKEVTKRLLKDLFSRYGKQFIFVKLCNR